MSRLPALLLALALLPGVAAAQPVIDGQLDPAFYYGPPRSVQDTPTAFGNATLGHRRISTSGSELDVVYARAFGGRLYLFIGGNLETGTQGLDWSGGIANRLEIFIDSIEGGQNRLLGNNADVDGNALGRMGELAPDPGLTFDAGFEADFYFAFYNFTEVVPTPDPQKPYGEAWRGAMWTATLPTTGAGTGSFLGVGADALPNLHVDEHVLAGDVRVGFDNSNVGGMNGTGDPVPVGDAGSVTRGIELSIPWTLIDGPLSDLHPILRIALLVNSREHHFLSNQTLGPLTQPSGGYGNLGEPRVTNLASIPGAQYFEVPLEEQLDVEPDLAAGREPRLHLPAPNPTGGSMEVGFALPRPGRVRLAIHDAQGRRVRLLRDQDAAGGEQRVRWDGRDDAGARVAPGVYLVRMEAAGVVRSRRIVMLGR